MWNSKWAVAAVLAVCLQGAPASLAQGPAQPFPDEWFFDGAQRPAVLKALEGKPALPLATDTWIGSEISISEQRGKVIVIDFWATWCGPCMAAIPENIEMVKNYQDKGLVFVGLHDANAGWDGAAGVVKDKSINYPVAKDAAGGTSAVAYKVQFWPTYIAIDRKGIVRAAGLFPNRVEDVVKILLAEEGPSVAEVDSSFGPEFYYGGANRPASLRALEGQPAPAVVSREWLGTPLPNAKWKDRLVVLHFTSPAVAMSAKQLPQLALLEKEFATQGVAFVGVCDADTDWASVEPAMKTAKLAISVMHDAAGAVVTPAAPPKDVADATAPKAARSQGATAKAYGVRFFPTTVVVDRAGKVRAAGVRIEKTKEVIEKLLAEKSE